MNDVSSNAKNGARGIGTSKAQRRSARAELIWDGKYDDAGRRVAPLRVALPFQTVETVNELAQDRQRSLQYGPGFGEEEWRNRLIWGDKKYVLPSLLAEFAGKVNLIYIDPPFDTGADFSFTAPFPTTRTTKTTIAHLHQGAEHHRAEGVPRYLGAQGSIPICNGFMKPSCCCMNCSHENGSIYVHLDWHVSSLCESNSRRGLRHRAVS